MTKKLSRLTLSFKEIELALEGEVPVPKRSGASSMHGVESELVHARKEDASWRAAFKTAELADGVLGREGTLQQKENTGTPSSVKARQPTLKRSKALSRPLADVTKMVNLASLASEGAEGEKTERTQVITGRAKQSRHNAFTPFGQAPTQKLEVYRDEVSARSAEGHHHGPGLRMATASIAGDLHKDVLLGGSAGFGNGAMMDDEEVSSVCRRFTLSGGSSYY